MKKNLLTHKNYFVPYISTDDNCLIVNVFHAIVKGVVKDDFFVVAGQFRHSCTDRRGYNLVIIAVGEVKSAIIIVVRHIVVNHDYGSPGVEDGVGDDGSERRAADDVVSIDIAAVNAVVEVVGDSVVIYRSDVMRDMHVAVVVVVIRVYVGSVGCRSVSRAMSGSVFARTSGLSVMSVFVVTVVVVGRSFVAGTSGYRLRRSLTLFCITSFNSRVGC